MAGKPVTATDGGVFDIPDDPDAPDAPSPASPPNAPSTSPAPGMSWRDAAMSFAQKHPLAAGVLVNPMLGIAGGMAPSPEFQNRVDLAKGLPDQPPAVPSAPTPPPQQPGGGMPGMPNVPRVGMPGFDFKGSQAKIDAATGMEAQGVQDAAAAEGKAAQIRAQSMADVATQQMQYAQQSQAARDAAFQKVQSQQAEVQKHLDELDKQKVDPNHFWATRSAAQSASAALGLAFSSFGSAFTHQPPVNLINDAIDRDIAAQRENIANSRSNLQARSNLLEQNYRIFNNYQDAADMTKAHMLDGLAKQGEAQAQQAATPAIQAKALQTVGQLKAQAEQLRQGTYGRQADISYKNNMLALDAYGKQIEAWKLTHPAGMVAPGGSMPLRPEDLKEIKDQEAAVRNLQQGATQNAETLKNLGVGDRARHFFSGATGGLVSDSPKYGVLNAAQEAMAVNANKAQGIPTAQTEKQYENMREGANTPNSPEKGITFSKAQVQAAREALANTYAARFGVPIEQAQAMVEQKLGPDPWEPDRVKEMIRQKAGQ